MSSRPAMRPRNGTITQNETHQRENVKLDSTKGKGKPRPHIASKVFCVCRKPDDGTPMIRCEQCREWFVFSATGLGAIRLNCVRYHFRCVGLSERDAEDIQTYICERCHQKTGLRTIMEWEGVDGLEVVNPPDVRSPTLGSEDQGGEAGEHESQSEDESADDYVAGAGRLPAGKRRSRRVSTSSDSDSDSGRSAKGPNLTKRIRRDVPVGANAPPPANGTKRKQPDAAQPAIKRSRTESGEDPARKYCLTKLLEVFTRIFTQYPFLNDGRQDRDAGVGRDFTPDKAPEELTDEEKEKLEATARQFTADLEQCMFAIYSEPDKTGKPHAAGKYKYVIVSYIVKTPVTNPIAYRERFRMLTFNLSKPDRVLLHKRIASSQIPPRELSTMSSTDLADEETKQSIKHAEQEALAHSILKKQTLPRAKITHKGIENIEDMYGAEQRDMERVREEEEEARIERERLARLKLQAERARSASSLGQGSVPPESPVVSQSSSWGAPHSLQSDSNAAHSMEGLARPAPNTMFVSSVSDYVGLVEPELNLADLINIDEDLPPDVAAVESPPSSTAPHLASSDARSSFSQASPTSESTPPVPSTTGISPFAAKSDITSRSSFDLSSLWTANGAEQTSEQPIIVDAPESERQEDPKASAVDVDILGEEADDQDFDMFLEKDEEDKPTVPVDDNSPEARRAAFEALPKVWTGTLSMPLDATMAQEVSLSACQVGGRDINHEPLLWQTLFPAKALRIDGRVPVEKSAQYLTQMRLNPTKELIAVAFSPDTGTGAEFIGFKALVDHLVAKGRHGLVFPWGNRPKEWAPGRELYIVPLLTTEAIPEFLELLDNLRLPKLRDHDFLIGVWVLGKNRLAPPPPGAMPAPAPINIAPSALYHQALHSPLGTQFLPQGQPTASTSTLGQPAPTDAVLAAEVAQLTPEQIQQMLRTLTSSALLNTQTSAVLPPPPPPQPVIPLPTSQLLMSQQQTIPIQPWLNQPVTFQPHVQPPALAPIPGNHPIMPPGLGPYPDPQYDRRYDQDRQYPPESIAEGVRLGAEVEAENMGIDLGILVGEDEVEGPARRAVGGGPTADDGINSRFVYIRSTLFTILLFSVSIGDATSILSLRVT
ncbi:predicted protein [Postia placenta Mad-698-R]|nr:predicted protein [Postia placenta Mad-698-R]